MSVNFDNLSVSRTEATEADRDSGAAHKNADATAEDIQLGETFMEMLEENKESAEEELAEMLEGLIDDPEMDVEQELGWEESKPKEEEEGDGQQEEARDDQEEDEEPEPEYAEDEEEPEGDESLETAEEEYEAREDDDEIYEMERDRLAQEEEEFRREEELLKEDPELEALAAQFALATKVTKIKEQVEGTAKASLDKKKSSIDAGELKDPEQANETHEHHEDHQGKGGGQDGSSDDDSEHAQSNDTEADDLQALLNSRMNTPHGF